MKKAQKENRNHEKIFKPSEKSVPSSIAIITLAEVKWYEKSHSI